MNKRVRYAIFACICIIISSLCSICNTTESIIQIIKYISLAYSVILLTYTILSLHKKRHCIHALLYVAVCILCVFIILVLDTYWLHALTWFPGIIRYALFSTYGWMHIVFFACIGILVYYGIEEPMI